MGQARDGDAQAGQALGDVVGGGLAVDGGAQRQDDLARPRGGRGRAIDQLAPGLGVLDARDAVVRQAMADAGLVAADAGADVVGAAGLGLGGERRSTPRGP